MVAVPWQFILSQTPALISAAGDLLSKSRRSSAEIATAKDLSALRESCERLARDQQEYAALVQRLTEQLNALSEALQVTARHAHWSMVVGAVGAAVGVAGCLIALLR